MAGKLIRTAALIVAWGFFATQGARQGDLVLAANSVLYNLMLTGAFFLDGFAAAAGQLCGRALGARDGHAFSRAVRLSNSSCRRRLPSWNMKLSAIGEQPPNPWDAIELEDGASAAPTQTRDQAGRPTLLASASI